MRCFIVSSTLTFVPENYEAFVTPLAENEHVAGLILVKNHSVAFLLKTLALILTGAAPRFGWQLLKNFFARSTQRKAQAYLSRGKKFFLVSDINSPETHELLRQENVDVLLNARTRAFYKKKTLELARYGCLNIHHGLLPDQRGLMCDFWAQSENQAFGFSIHQMTTKLDDGPILQVTQTGFNEKDYLHSIAQSAATEARSVLQLLPQIAQQQGLQGQTNLKTTATVYRSNPGLKDFYRARLQGMKI